MAKTTTMIFRSILIALISQLISITNCDSLEKTKETIGFTVDLIHRDSPQSPSYNPSLSHYQHLTNAFKRSFDRVHRFKTNPYSSKSPRSDIVNSNGEYLMKYSIGTPPVPSLAIADTGSDVIWTQCQPCIQCFNQTLPFFKPKNSSTYKTIPCNTPQCKSFVETSCSPTRKNCLYSETYGDGSFTNGLLATDTITLDSSDGNGRANSFPNVIFGCGFKNGGIFDGGESGIVGLGGGKGSLVRQLGQGKFSYCLVSISATSNSSKLNFGANAEVSGRGVVTTPMVKKDPDTFYYLTLEGISVGNQRLGFDDDGDRYSKINGGDGNVVIDSGTTLTLLPFDIYNKYEKAIRGFIKLKEFKDPKAMFGLCYVSKDDIKNIPDVTVHFRGADVKWKYDNVFVRISDEAVCLAAQGVSNVGIFGNLAQVNFLVGYDLVKRTVSFKAADCTRS